MEVMDQKEGKAERNNRKYVIVLWPFVKIVFNWNGNTVNALRKCTCVPS